MLRLTDQLFLCAAAWTLLGCSTFASTSAGSPNIIIVLADDLGWGDPQCYQADSRIPTPAIDRLAAEGLRFTDAHTPSSVCTPTRYALLTGRYAWRTRLKSGVLDGFDPPLIGSQEDTLASLLRRNGYSTHCVGKWHLGLSWLRKDGSPVPDRDVSKGFRQGLDVDFSEPFSGGPLDVGFDTFFGISASLDMSPYCWLRGNQVIANPTIETPVNRDGLFMNQVAGLTTADFELTTVLPRLGEETVRIIRESKRHESPFFCYLPLTSPHLPVVPTPESAEASGAGAYGDFVVETDRVLGRILQALDDTNQAEETFLVFTSDNGGLFHWWDFRADDDGGSAPVTRRGKEVRQFGHQSNDDWRGTKADIFEGGHRVPFLIRWPDRTEGGRIIDQTVELTDLFATIADITGEVGMGTSGMDSFSFLSLITDAETDSEVRPFAIHHSLNGTFAIREGPWKLIEGRGSGGFTRPRTIQSNNPPGQLYHLGEDPKEQHNRYHENPGVIERLTQLLKTTQSSSALDAAGQ